MYYVIFISLVLFLIGYVLYTKPMLINFRYDSEENNIKTHSKWLSPFFRTEISMHKNRPTINLFLFNRKIVIKHFDLVKWTKKVLRNYKTLHLRDLKIEAYYGLASPFSVCITNSITNSIIDFIKPCTDDIVFIQHPDLVSGKRYVIIQAKCKLNLGKTILALIRKKFREKQKEDNIMNQINLTDNLDALFHSLENFTQKEGVIGKAVTQNEKTMMPIVSITVGYGGGNVSMGKDTSSSYTAADSGSGALGFGAKLCTDAILVIDTQQNVSILPMTAAAASTQIIDKIPQIINGMKQTAQAGPTA